MTSWPRFQINLLKIQNTLYFIGLVLLWISLCTEKLYFKLAMAMVQYSSFRINQCWGSVTFWCESGSVTFWCGSRSANSYLWLIDPNPDPTPDPTPFFSDFKKDAKNIFFHIFSYTRRHIILREGSGARSVPLRLWLMDPDTGGLKTCGSCGSDPQHCGKQYIYGMPDFCFQLTCPV